MGTILSDSRTIHKFKANTRDMMIKFTICVLLVCLMGSADASASETDTSNGIPASKVVDLLNGQQRRSGSGHHPRKGSGYSKKGKANAWAMEQMKKLCEQADREGYNRT